MKTNYIRKNKDKNMDTNIEPPDYELIGKKFEDAETPKFSSLFTLDEANEFGFIETALTEAEAREASSEG